MSTKQEVIEKRMEKLEKKMSDTEVSEIKVADTAKLKSMVFELSKKIEDLENEKKADSKLNAAKEVVKDLSSAYKDVLSPKKVMLSYVLLTIQQKENNG